jgi:hypothetical protein
MSWSKDYKKSIDCDNPKGFSQKAHCAGRKKREGGGETKSKSPFSEDVKGVTFSKFSHKTKHLSKSQHQLDPNLDLKHIVHHSTVQYVDRDADGDVDIYDNPNKKTPDENVLSAPERAKVFSKKLIAKQKGELKHTRRGMAYEETISEEGLRDWFGKSKSKDGKKGWVNVVTGDSCASDKPGEGIPKCVSSAKRASMSKKERLAAAAAKRREDPGQQEKSGASKPTMVKTDRKVRKEEIEVNEAKDKPGKGSGKKDACYHKVKSRYDVWPSAYASGALVKCRKVGAANWGTKSEAVEMIRYCPACNKNEMQQECKIGPAYWAMYSQPVMLTTNQMKYNIATVHPTNEERDHEYSMARSELSTIIAAAKRLKKKMRKGEGNIEAWVQSKITKAADYIDTAADYVESGEHNESVKIEDANGNHYAEFVDIIKPESLKPSTGIGSQILDEAGKKCWKGYKKAGTQTLFGKTYNRCVKEDTCPICGFNPCQCLEGTVESFTIDKGAHKTAQRREKIRALVNRGEGGEKDVAKKKLGVTAELPRLKEFTQFMEDWQKVNKSDKTDGMSPAAVKAYRRENPGSKLKTAVTGDPKPGSKDAKRRKSFCSRSKGQQDMHNIDCSKTPDKAICKARRRWKC